MGKNKILLGVAGFVVALLAGAGGGALYLWQSGSLSLGGTYRDVQPATAMLTASSTTYVTSTPLRMDKQRHANCSVAAANKTAYSGTVRFLGSFSDAPPNFYNAVSSTNMFDRVQVIDLQDGSAVNGDLGVVMTTEDYRNFAVNKDYLKWLVVIASSTSGAVTVDCTPVND